MLNHCDSSSIGLSFALLYVGGRSGDALKAGSFNMNGVRTPLFYDYWLGACDSQYGGDGDGGYLVSGGGVDMNANYELVGCFRIFLGFEWRAGAKLIGACDRIWMDSGTGILLTFRVGCGWVYDWGCDGMFGLNDIPFHIFDAGIGACCDYFHRDDYGKISLIRVGGTCPDSLWNGCYAFWTWDEVITSWFLGAYQL